MIEAAFRSVREAMDPQGTVVQLIGFSDRRHQLPLYLAAMAAAGFDEMTTVGELERLTRRVPNRKWYAKLQGNVDAASELLLLHRPRARRRERRGGPYAAAIPGPR